MRIINNNKLICNSSKYYLFSKGPRLYVSNGIDENCEFLGILPCGSLKSMLGSMRVIARALRLEPRCGIFVNDNIALISFHGAIYRVDCNTHKIEVEHHYRPEMNNPLWFTKVEGVKGFTDGIYYGEYFLNHEGLEVNIHRRESDGTWPVVYTYQSGSIYHIHAIVPCRERECVYILTGDKDQESGIFECKNDFKQVNPIVQGKQAYRACVALPTANGLLYTTDTPLEENYLYHLDFSTKEIKPIMAIAGPCIYGKMLSETEMVFSTSVESDSRLPRWRYEFSQKLGPGVKDRYTHLYHVKVDGDNITAKEIFKAKKDILPMGAGQMGTLMFPTGDGQLLITAQSVRKYDNKTFSIDLRELQ